MLDQELFDLLEGTSDAAFTVTDQGEICSWNKPQKDYLVTARPRFSRRVTKDFCRGAEL